MARTSEDPAAEGALVVDASEAGLRLDAFLARRKLVPSSSAARRAVAAGVVRVNGHLGKKGVHLAPGDAVDMCGGPDADAVLVPMPQVDLSVLYQDDDLVAVDKPPGLASHPLRPGDAATVAAALVARFPECAAASPDAREGGLGHRLDVATSGVLLAARSRQTWHRLREALASASCEKLYLAESRGCFPAGRNDADGFVVPGPRPASLVVTVPIGRQGRHGGRVKLASGRHPLAARTELTLVEAREGSALIEARLSQGRAHQVRAHLAYLGIPVLGDPVYGEAESDGNLRLHAFTVSLLHPITGKPLRIEAPLPGWARRRP
jgi:23S rRNA pseudouridine1911/1915/1917 synthase